MAIIFSDRVIEVALQHLISGRTSVNVVHVKLGILDIGGPEANSRDVVDNWQDHIVPLMTSNVTFTGAEWRSLDESDSSSGFLVPDDGKPTVGEQTESPLPPNTAFLVRKQVTGRARGERNGRMYIAGVQEASVDGAGNLGGAIPALFETGLADFFSGVTGGIGPLNQLVVLTIPKAAREKGDAEFTVGTNEVTQLVLDPKVATMRRRLR